ncbi:peptidylprolyl isomerase [Rhodobacteraceae bacterium PA1-206B]
MRGCALGAAVAAGLGLGGRPADLAPGLAAGALFPPAQAQNLFAPSLYVNDQVITRFEVIQRALFLQVLRQPGNPEEEALKSLVNERLQRSEATRLGIRLSEAEVVQGMEEFAARASLSAEELVAELQKVGIAAETFRDFVSSGLLWRHAVRARYLGQVTATEAEVDRLQQSLARPRALKVQLSELVIPMEPGNEDAAVALATRLSAQIGSEAAFAAAARNHSAAPSAASGGRVTGWLPLSELPGSIAAQIVALGEGQASAPVVVPNAVVLFLLREIAQDETAAPVRVTLDWADYLIPADPEAAAAEIARVRTGTDTCTDLYALNAGRGDSLLSIHSQPLAQVPQDVALELARLDPGEFSTALTRDGWRRLVMLCGRKAEMEPEPTRDQLREQVINQKIEGLAGGYLEELRAAAFIREP